MPAIIDTMRMIKGVLLAKTLLSNLEVKLVGVCIISQLSLVSLSLEVDS